MIGSTMIYFGGEGVLRTSLLGEFGITFKIFPPGERPGPPETPGWMTSPRVTPLGRAPSRINLA